MKLLTCALMTVAGLQGSLAAQNLPERKFPEIVYYADAYADHYHVPRALVHAFITQESGWNRNALSSKGAIGLMQLMPGTAARFAVRNSHSISDNLSGGIQYLALLSSMFRGDWRWRPQPTTAVSTTFSGEGSSTKTLK